MKKRILVGALGAWLLGACSGPGEAPVRGGLRIVSVSKQLTEIIFAVGGDTALVGRDISSTWPEAAKKITAVGYHRALAPEGIISLDPTAVWNDGNWGPPATIEQLKKV